MPQAQGLPYKFSTLYSIMNAKKPVGRQQTRLLDYIEISQILFRNIWDFVQTNVRECGMCGFNFELQPHQSQGKADKEERGKKTAYHLYAQCNLTRVVNGPTRLGPNTKIQAPTRPKLVADLKL